MRNEKVAVVIPFYNGDFFFFRKTLNGILTQSYPNFKIYLIDDGSCKEKKEGLKTLVNEISDNRIFLYSISNRGTGEARKFGIEQADEKYIALCDQDDIWEENKLEKQINVIEKEKVDLVSCHHYRVYYEKEEIKDIKKNIELVSSNRSGKEVAERLLFTPGWGGGCPSTLLFLKESYIKAIPYMLTEKGYCEDVSMILAMAFCDCRFKVLGEQLVLYNVHSTNQSKSVNYYYKYNMKHIFYYLHLFEDKFAKNKFAKLKKRVLYNAYLNYSGRLFDMKKYSDAYKFIKKSLEFRICSKNIRRLIKYKIFSLLG